MDYINQIFKTILNPFVKLTVVKPQINSGPNTLEELLKQFDNPTKPKSQEQVVQDYCIKETMASLEVDFLKDCPVSLYKGTQRWKDNEGNIFFDWVPCSVRPEVVYCSYGKN
jgi:hypothetical protein